MWLGVKWVFILAGYREAFFALEVKIVKYFLFPGSGPLLSPTLLWRAASPILRGGEGAPPVVRGDARAVFL